MMSTPTHQLSHTQPHGMTVNQLVGLFQLNLVLSFIAQSHCTIQSSLRLGFDNIITMVGFVNQDADRGWRNFNNATANRKIFKLIIAITLGVTDR